MYLKLEGISRPILVDSWAAYAPTAVAQIETITTVADVAGSLNNKLFFLFSAAAAQVYLVWFNVASAGVDPTTKYFDIGHLKATQIPVAIATNATAPQVATALNAALTGKTGFTVGVASNVVTVTMAASGRAPSPVDGIVNVYSPGVGGPGGGIPVFNDTTGFAFAVTTPGSITVPTGANLMKVTGRIASNKEYTDTKGSHPLLYNYIPITVITNDQRIQEFSDAIVP